MLATGFVVLEKDDTVATLQKQAREILEAPPTLNDDKLQVMRYMAALLYEDALDMKDDPPTATMILGQAVHGMLHYAFRQAGQWLPREKELLTALQTLNPQLAAWAQEFYATPTFERRLQLAEQIPLIFFHYRRQIRHHIDFIGTCRYRFLRLNYLNFRRVGP